MTNFKELLIGFAIGDAFGAGVEFQDRNWIRSNVDFTRFVNARHKINVPKNQQDLFTKNYKIWDYTDDTEMLIASIKTIISDNTFSEVSLLEKILNEYQKGMQEKGYGRNGHGSLSWYFTGKKSINEIRNFQKSRKNPGNAPLSRAIPLAFIKPDLINKYAEINANTTHPNPNTIIASQCIAKATAFLLIQKGENSEVIKHCQENVELNAEYQDYLQKVDSLEQYEGLDDTGFEILLGKQPICEPYFLANIKGLPSDAKYTVGAVLYILKNSQNTFDTLQKSIYLGGDVDSLASICTGIMAFKYGIDSLPNFMLENVEGKIYLHKIAKDWGNYYYRSKH